MRIPISILWIVAAAQAATYFEWSNHDGVQVGSKYVYFAEQRGTKPTPETYNEATASCEATGGELAYPVDEVEDAAFMQFLTEHFHGDVEAVEEGLGAWLGIHMNSTGGFVYNDGTEAGYVPIDFFSRLVADFAICLSMTHGRVFNEDTAEFEETLVWDEGFCRRHRMPLCMVDLSNEVSCVMVGDDITSDVIESDCDGYSRCVDGNFTEYMCEGGMRFSTNGSDFGGECIDARAVPECDIDECDFWNVTSDATCPVNSVSCTNHVGTHECECDTGLRFNDSATYWDYDTWSCDDIDECAEGTDDCNDDSDCMNTFGSFWCECHAGFYYEDFSDAGECVDYDECVDGVYYDENSWPPQLLGDPVNFDSNDTWEYVDACHADAFCSNLVGTFNCTCNDGFRMNASDLWTCEDIDECAEGIDACHADSWCNNTYGDYECYCNDGYYGDGFECVDSDECGDMSEAGWANNVTDHLYLSNECSDQGFCTNTIGGYNCTCDDGFYGSGYNCTDGNECGDEIQGTTDGINDFYFDTHECNPEGTCINTFGGYNCTCNDGFYGDGFNCSDSNECGDMPIGMAAGVQDPIFDSHMCSSEGTCSNTWGGYNCTCDDGFYGDGFNCTDGNECGDAAMGMAAGVMDHYYDDHMCDIQASCINTFGAYNCSCNLGWEGDGWNCTDIDECREEMKMFDTMSAAPDALIGGYDFCSNDAECTNTPGGYNCTCNEGFEGNGFNCTDIDECAHGIDECDLEGDRAWCNNTIGSYECYCKDGYYGDGFSCTNSDECGSVCEGEACDYNECNSAGDAGETCMYDCWPLCSDPTEIGIHMNVSDGWWGSHQCNELAVCNDTIGSYDCFCNWGFEGNGYNCTDVDECDLGTDMCHADAFCTNEFGGYNCTCNVGYIGDGFNCTDIDECEAEDACNEEATCNNVIGSYECSCNDGFFGDGFIECWDSDECAEAPIETVMTLNQFNTWGYPVMDQNISDPLHTVNGCSPQGYCMNTYGGYNCTCNDGFYGSGWNCTDGNECGDDTQGTTDGIEDFYFATHECNAEGTCINTFGGYNCTCDEGFYGDGFNCSDSNECGDMPIGMAAGVQDPIFDSHMCSSEGTCSNTWGGYNCTCDDGFYGDGFNCTDGNECGDAPMGMAAGVMDHYHDGHMCHVEASCINTFGAYNCSCNLGWEGTGWNCTEIDECRAKIEELRAAAPPHLIGEYDYCHDDAFCTNTPGGYNCTCNEGFDGDGFDCTDVDECALGIDECDLSMDRAWCNNTYGGYECYCNDGYYGDGFSCTNSDECGVVCGGDDCGYSCQDAADQGEECMTACWPVCEGPTDVGMHMNVSDSWYGTHQCSELGICNDTVGSYSCSCPWGFDGDGFNCTDIDECGTDTDMCHTDAVCENDFGGYNCTCDVGYIGDGFNCTDIDECEEDDACHTDATCSNNIGNYECTCNEGFFGDGFLDCMDSDECAEGNVMWVTQMGSVNTWGYDISDMNMSDPLHGVNGCSAQGYCMNTYGGYNCTCNDGFYGSGWNCTDGNECGDATQGNTDGILDFYFDTHECDAEGTCTNTFGGYNCSCDEGFYGDGFNCSDSNECGDMPIGMAAGVQDPIFDSHMCSSEGACTNTWGGYNCTCDDGFYGDGFNCTDGNECGDAPMGMAAGVMDHYHDGHMCHAEASCINTFGAYNCSCNLGYEGTGWNCTEIDECRAKIEELRSMAPPHLIGDYDYCHDDAFCTNTPGGYNCTCNEGFAGDGFNCTDVDECDLGTDMCHDDAVCTNELGGYNCTCMDGFFGDGFNCSDINECDEGTDQCHDNAWCNNTYGDYECYCDDGFYGDGFACEDSDECARDPQGMVANVSDHNWGNHECHAEAWCNNQVGTYNCTCNEGWQGDGFNCTDFNECEEDTDDCSDDGFCMNTIGSYDCACDDGYFGDGFICVDSDECAEGSEAMTVMNATDSLYGMHACSADAFCSNTIGDYNCTCNEGYRGNGWNCSDINECDELSDECHDEALCSNTIGSYDCTCDDGFFGDGWICEDSDECAEGVEAMVVMNVTDPLYDGHTCHADAFCMNSYGAYNCTCNEGFTGNGWNCSDVDECAEGTDDCSDNAECSNTYGSWECDCDDGWFGDGVECIDSDECGEGSEAEIFLNVTDPWFMDNDCNMNAMCTNAPGSYNCTCTDGYEGDGFNCTDINECEVGSDECHVDAECTNTIGGYNCSCIIGYEGDGFDCDDVDECRDEFRTVGGLDDCHDMASCVNFPGGYNCTCDTGYYGDGYNCSDSDECNDFGSMGMTGGVSDLLWDTNSCSDSGTCINTDGGYNCSCNDGFFGDGFDCTDSNECGDLPIVTTAGVEDPIFEGHGCHAEAACINTVGAYNCSCELGWEGDGYNCSDIDECRDMRMVWTAASDELIGGLDFCDDNAMCANTPGGYNCSCNHGYEGDGFNCTNIDECAEGIDMCHDEAECTDTDGHYTCECNDGYYGDGYCCIDGDECGTGDVLTDSFDDWSSCMEIAHLSFNDTMSPMADMYFATEQCSVDAACGNTAGSYNCTCNDGYQGDGFNCIDVNECDEGTDDCDVNAFCSNTIGAWECACMDGYSGDGTDGNCTDINECEEETDDCDVNAYCENTIGSWDCTCMDGYYGNGIVGNCTDIDECAEEDLNDCDSNAMCNNTVGGYECFCDAGYYGDGFACEDSDECGYSNCEDECAISTNCTDVGVAGTMCSTMCIPVCETNDQGMVHNVTDLEFASHMCSEQGSCTNHDGGYNCTCDWGWAGDGFNCMDINECGMDTDECDENAMCMNEPGAYSCQCHQGYSGNGFECLDVNECNLDLDECDDNAECINTIGAYNCSCNDGYEGDGWNCTNIDECALDIDECHDEAVCTDTEGSYNCTCLIGFEGNGFDCLDINECEMEMRMDGPCDMHAACENTYGSYDCACNDGYFGDGWLCTDSNECGDAPIATDVNNVTDETFDTHMCDAAADCTNTEGDYNCTCMDGYEGDGFNCENIDECAVGSDTCHEDAFCTDDVPGYNCTCNIGYVGDGFDCVDDDECQLGTDDCDENALCENEAGGFSCTCNDGYRDASCPEGYTSDFGLCHKYHETVVTHAEAIADCESQGAWLAYVVGSDHSDYMSALAMTTTAWLGYTLANEDGLWRWRDVNGDRFPDGYTNWHQGQPDKLTQEECMHFTTLGKWKNAECSKTRSYICQTVANDPGRNCSDINECTEPGADELCDTNGVCQNFDGGFFCECADGFQGDGTPGNCADIDECVIPGLADCHEQATCENTIGSFECNCNEGFVLANNGVACRDIHECFDEVDDCDDNAVCENTIGSFSCTCNDGYSGPGDVCFDVEECSQDQDDCNDNAACTNTDGGYECECNTGKLCIPSRRYCAL